MIRSRWLMMAPFLALAIAAPSRDARADCDANADCDAPALDAPAQPSARPVSPYVELSIGAGLQEDTRHDQVHGSARTRVSGGITFPFGLRIAVSTWMQTFYDSASLSWEEGIYERGRETTSASASYLGGLELGYRPSWDPFAFHAGVHAGVGYGQIVVVDDAALDIREEGRLAIVAGAHVSAGVAVFGNFDLLLRIDADYAVVGERSAFLLSGSVAVEWH